MKDIINDEEFVEFYRTHSTKSTKNHFNLTDKPFNQLLQKLNIEPHDRALNIKLTNLEKYGCENVFQLNYIKDKSENTKLQKYGTKTYNNPESRKLTCMEKYKSSSASGSKAIQEKIAKTNLERYGVDNPFKDRSKIEASYINKYGSLENFNNYCSSQRKAAVVKKYGVENVSQIPNIADKANESRRLTCLKKYGVESATLLPQCMFSAGNTSLSNPNCQFVELLSCNNIDYISQEFTIKNRSYDIKLSNDILIEINPTATHNSTWSPFGDKFVKSKNYHSDKTQLALDNGYRCICVWDWDDKDVVIKNLLPRDIIYARNCEVNIVDKHQVKTFLTANHFQGYARSSINIGLYYNGELVSVMTFGKPRYNKKYEYELIRYCSSKNIIGGSAKLLKYFERNYSPKSIISYCDLSKFTGNIYTKLGFTLIKTSIGRHWFNIKTKQHITDNLLRQRGFDQLFGTSYGKGTSNEELIRKYGFVDVYDCGQATYVKIFEESSTTKG